MKRSSVYPVTFLAGEEAEKHVTKGDEVTGRLADAGFTVLSVNEECARRLFQLSGLGKSKQKQADEGRERE